MRTAEAFGLLPTLKLVEDLLSLNSVDECYSLTVRLSEVLVFFEIEAGIALELRKGECDYRKRH